MSPDTVYRHAGLVCSHLNRPAPKKVTKAQLEKGKKELLAIRGVTESTVHQLLQAGIIDTAGLLAADPRNAALQAGLPEESLKNLQALARTKLENAIIQL